jgi:hypothetical protein
LQASKKVVFPLPASQAEALQYRDGVAVDTSNAAEMEAFNAFKSAHQELAPASREVLRPEIAAISMSGSSLLVAINALLVKRHRLEGIKDN